MIKKAWAVWQGGIKDGGGTISTETGVLKEAPYGFKARFENGKGTNPEELIGAAHAGCFSMALSLMLGEAGLTAEKIETHAAVTLEKTRAPATRSRRATLGVRKDSGSGRREVPGDREQGQDGVSGVEAAEGDDHDGREAGDMNGAGGGNRVSDSHGPGTDPTCACQAHVDHRKAPFTLAYTRQDVSPSRRRTGRRVTVGMQPTHLSSLTRRTST